LSTAFVDDFSISSLSSAEKAREYALDTCLPAYDEELKAKLGELYIDGSISSLSDSLVVFLDESEVEDPMEMDDVEKVNDLCKTVKLILDYYDETMPLNTVGDIAEAACYVVDKMKNDEGLNGSIPVSVQNDEDYPYDVTTIGDIEKALRDWFNLYNQKNVPKWMARFSYKQKIFNAHYEDDNVP